MFYTVYILTNLVNGRFYVGKHQTSDLNDGYMGSGQLIRRALKKHGVENFRKEYLGVYETEREMNLAERVFVVIDREVSYNLCPGGRGGWGYINENALGNSSKGGLNCAAKKNFDALIAAGQKVTIARSRNGSCSAIAKIGHQKGTLGFAGRTHTEETKAKIRASHSSKSHPRGPRGPYKKLTSRSSTG